MYLAMLLILIAVIASVLIFFNDRRSGKYSSNERSGRKDSNQNPRDSLPQLNYPSIPQKRLPVGVERPKPQELGSGVAAKHDQLTKWLALDIETTGLQNHDRIITIGLVRPQVAENSEVRLSLTHLVFNPGVKSHPRARAVHGWDDRTLKHQDPFSDHAAKIHAELLGAEILIGHNIQFDVKFLMRELQAAGYRWPSHLRLVCTMEHSRKRWPFESAKLDDVCRRFELARTGTTHGALEDAFLALMIWFGLSGLSAVDKQSPAFPAPTNLREIPPDAAARKPRRKAARKKKNQAPPEESGSSTPGV